MQRGLIEPVKLQDLRKGQAFRALARDLDLLRLAFQSQWSVISGKSAVTPEDLETAARLSRELLDVLTSRADGTVQRGSAIDWRQRAFTLLSRAYDDARAAIAYVRRQRTDAESIAPSLYVATKRSKEQDQDSPISRPRSRADG